MRLIAGFLTLIMVWPVVLIAETEQERLAETSPVRGAHRQCIAWRAEVSAYNWEVMPPISCSW